MARILSFVNGKGVRRRETVLIALVVAGSWLRILQYLAGSALWLDEVVLASNILQRSVWKLLTVPLGYDQVAPKGFLLLEKIATVSFGSSDYSLRLVPFLCSLAAVILFWRVVRVLLAGIATPIALLLFATAPPLVTFSAEVKQYSVDVAVALFLLWVSFGLVTVGISGRRAFWSGVAGAFAVWFSQPGAIVVVALALSVGWVRWVARDELDSSQFRRLTICLAVWILAALIAGMVGLASMTAGTREYLRGYWAAGIRPPVLSHPGDLLWPWNQIRALFGSGNQASLGYPHPSLYVTLAAIGLAVLSRRNGRLAVLIISPLVLALAAAEARLYPFSDRLILFLVPGFMIGIAESIGWIHRMVCRRSGFWRLPVLFLAVPPLYSVATMPPPYRIEDLKVVMAYVRSRWLPGDKVYVYYAAAPAFTFYSKEYGFSGRDYEVGGCHRDDNPQYVWELEKLRGHGRVWVVLTHAVPAYRERDEIYRYLDTTGARRASIHVPSRVVSGWAMPAEAVLYDLSEPPPASSAILAPVLSPTASPNPCDGFELRVPPR